MAQVNEGQAARIAASRAAITAKQGELARANLARLNGEQPPAREPEPLPQERTNIAPGPQPVEQPAPVQAIPEPIAQGPTIEELQEQLRVLQERFNWQEGHFRAEGQRERQKREAAQAAAAQATQLAETERQARIRLEQEQERSRPITDADLLRYLPQGEIDRMGTEAAKVWVQAQRIIAGEISGPAVQSAVDEARRDATAARQEAQQIRSDAFWDRVREAVPDWDVVDKTSGFLQWLGGVDDLTGKTRRDLGVEARDSFNHRRFIAIYKQYKATLPVEQPPATPQRGMIPTNRGKGEVRTEIPAQPAVTAQEMKDFERRAARGEFKTAAGQKELAAFKKRIMDARGGQGR
jgi:hypothetical protein